ncbi:MAG TPA: queuosine precursor transporter [Saprospiraceae bacterium]|nr:queuosine precursor transporter [Saprospiraceae bacterium]HND87206.1 queuosine precursor transporter [Saprospiraceae bacterium]
MRDFFSSKPTRLWILLAGFFITNALVAEFIGVKLFSLEKTLGLQPVNWTLLGQQNLAFTLTAGVLLWPMVFVMTDIINEYYGRRGVRTLSYLTAGLIAYGFVMLYMAIHLEPADFWRTAHLKPSMTEAEQAALMAKVSDYSAAYDVVFGQSTWIIVGSLTAFLVAQIVDVGVFHQIKKHTGEERIWLRSTGSTLVSQFLDSFVVVFIALYIGQQIPFVYVLAISIMSYLYKALVAVLMTPVIYLIHAAIDRYLGADLAAQMKEAAHRE